MEPFEEKERLFYDTDIITAEEVDWQSDNEPPTDKVFERKLLYKEELWRLSKEIIKPGSGLRKPASYDEAESKILILQL
jgi:hypothetical protein